MEQVKFKSLAELLGTIKKQYPPEEFRVFGLAKIDEIFSGVLNEKIPLKDRLINFWYYLYLYTARIQRAVLKDTLNKQQIANAIYSLLKINTMVSKLRIPDQIVQLAKKFQFEDVHKQIDDAFLGQGSQKQLETDMDKLNKKLTDLAEENKIDIDRVRESFYNSGIIRRLDYGMELVHFYERLIFGIRFQHIQNFNEFKDQAVVFGIVLGYWRATEEIERVFSKDSQYKIREMTDDLTDLYAGKLFPVMITGKNDVMKFNSADEKEKSKVLETFRETLQKTKIYALEKL